MGFAEKVEQPVHHTRRSSSRTLDLTVDDLAQLLEGTRHERRWSEVVENKVRAKPDELPAETKAVLADAISSFLR